MIRRLLKARKTRPRAVARPLAFESLEGRRLLAQLMNNIVNVQVNEYGAFGRSTELGVAFGNSPTNNTVGDAFYTPVNPSIGGGGTTYESAIAIGLVDPTTGLNVGAPRQFLTAGYIANTPPQTGPTNQGGNISGRFLQSGQQNNLERNSRFFWPNNIVAPSDPNQIDNRNDLPPGNPILMIDLQQTLVDLQFMGSPDGTALVQQYTIENVSSQAISFEVIRYFDGDIFNPGTPISDGGGERTVDVRSNVNSVFQTDTVGNPVGDLTFIEVQSSMTGVPNVGRWEVGLADPVPPNGDKDILPGSMLERILNPPNAAAANPLTNSIVPTGASDVALGLRNVYINVAGDPPNEATPDPLNGGVVVFTTITVFGHPPRTPITPIPPPPQLGRVEGVKFLDRNADGIRDPGEPGVPGFVIYADLNQNGVRDNVEPTAFTDQNGFYSLDVPIGVHHIREVNKLNWTQTGPLATLPPADPLSTPMDGFYEVDIAMAGDLVIDQDFGNVPDPGSISGVKFEDDNRSGVQEPNEPGMAGVTIYLDLDGDGILDAGEPQTVTNAQGNYAFLNLEPGDYVVREVVPEGFEQTTPGGNGAHQVEINAGLIVTGVNFGNRLLRGSIEGVKWNDLDGDGVRDSNEPGVGGAIIYIDENQNGVFNLGEKAAVTDSFGNYRIGDLLPGEYFVRELTFAGSQVTFPSQGVHHLLVFAGLPTLANFGNRANFDFGDAPESYGTLLPNGARHAILPGFRLGARIDGEPNGQPTPDATGDDVNGGGFAPPVSFAVGDGPRDLLLVDVTGDGISDLVTADFDADQVSVAAGVGDGTFAPPVSFDVDVNPVAVFAADLNGDGARDLIVAHAGVNDVLVLLNDGTGDFGGTLPLDFNAGAPQSDVVVFDVDEDGDLDIVVSRPTPANDVVLLRNITDATLAFDDPVVITPPQIPAQTDPVKLELGRIDADNLLDLVVVYQSSNSIGVLRNLPGGDLASPLTYSVSTATAVGAGPRDVVIADLDGDGDRDLAVANETSQNITVFYNNGAGAFPIRRSFPISPDTLSGGPVAITAGAFDGRPGLDLAVAIESQDAVALLTNDGSGNFTVVAEFPTGDGPIEIAATLLDFDTVFDIVTLNRGSDSVSVLTFTGGDEDGVTFAGPFVPGRVTGVTVNASAPGFLSAWFDFNRDGVFTASDRIFQDVQLVAGNNPLVVQTPVGLDDGPVITRFRFSGQAGIGPTGPANSGEVEDYQILVQNAAAIPSTGHTNLANPEDVDGNGFVELFDVLLVVNDLRANGIRALPPVSNPPPPPPFLDVNGNGLVDLNDVLRVIQRILSLQGAIPAEAEAEPDDPFESTLDNIAGDVSLAWMEQ